MNWDIERSGPRALHIGLNKPEYNLSNNDILGSKPQCVQFKSIRNGDPLNPTYNLSKVEVRPATPPKFVRDSISNDDIEGAKPKRVAYYQTRNIMEIGDIEGAATKKPPRRNSQYSNMDYTGKKAGF